MKNNTQLHFIIIILAILAAVLSIYVWQSHRFSWELSLIIRLQAFDNNTLSSVMEWVSYLSTGWRSAIIVIFSGLLLAWRKGMIEGCLLVLAGLLVQFNYLIKLAVGQTRPDSPLIRILSPETDYGYPSGHMFFATVVMGLLAYLLFTTLRRTIWRNIFMVMIIIVIFLIGISRIYLGAHWPSDVLGGCLIGGFFLSCLILFYVRIKALL